MAATLASPAAEFINQLRCRGVRLDVDGSNLTASPRSLLTDDDRVTIRKWKAALLTLLTVPNDAPDTLPEWVYSAIDAAFPIGRRTEKAEPSAWEARHLHQMDSVE